MAISWDVKITPINISTYEASIVATRTDDTDPTTLKTYCVPRAIIKTVPQQIAVMDEIWAKHQAALAAGAVAAAFVTAKEVAGKSNLEARE